MLRLDFTPSFGASADTVLKPLTLGLGRWVAALTVVIPVLANAWLVWRRWARRGRVAAERLSGREWLGEYALWVFAACMIANALSPAPAMWWHNVIALHAAVLPVVLWSDLLLRSRRAAAVRKGMVVYAAVSVLILFGMAFGSRRFRTGGRDAVATHVYIDHGMLTDLGLDEYRAEDPEAAVWVRMNRFFYQEYLRPFEPSNAARP